MPEMTEQEITEGSEICRTILDKGRLARAGAEFHDAMLRKLIQKMFEGHTGWNKKENYHVIKANLIEHFGRGLEGDNLVDIANFCMMLWRLGR